MIRQCTLSNHRSIWMVDNNILELKLSNEENNKDWEAYFIFNDSMDVDDSKVSSVKIVLSAIKEFKRMLTHPNLKDKVILIDPLSPEHSYNFFLSIGFRPIRTYSCWRYKNMLYYINTHD